MSDRRIVELDGLRGISIVMVLLGHLLTWRYGSVFPEPMVQIGAFLSNFGVLTFFGISGFIITSLAIEESRLGLFRVRRFYERRAIRILPAFSVYLLTVAALAAGGVIDQDLEGIGMAALFACNVRDDCGWFVGHSWTLAYESQFYLLFPAFLLLGQRLTAILLTIVLASALGVVAGLLPDSAKSIAFIAGGCLVASAKAFLLPAGDFRLFELTKRIARLRFFQFFGMISYSLYLWQQLFTSSPRGYPVGGVLEIPILALPIAVLSHRILEKDLAQWLKRKLIVPVGSA